MLPKSPATFYGWAGPCSGSHLPLFLMGVNSAEWHIAEDGVITFVAACLRKGAVVDARADETCVAPAALLCFAARGLQRRRAGRWAAPLLAGLVAGEARHADNTDAGVVDAAKLPVAWVGARRRRRRRVPSALLARPRRTSD
jgi:hypothetical protein